MTRPELVLQLERTKSCDEHVGGMLDPPGYEKSDDLLPHETCLATNVHTVWGSGFSVQGCRFRFLAFSPNHPPPLPPPQLQAPTFDPAKVRSAEVCAFLSLET